MAITVGSYIQIFCVLSFTLFITAHVLRLGGKVLSIPYSLHSYSVLGESLSHSLFPSASQFLSNYHLNHSVNSSSVVIAMRGILAYALLAAVVSTAPQLYERGFEDDDDCDIEWVTVFTNNPSSTSIIASSAVPTGKTSNDTILPTATLSTPAAADSSTSVGTPGSTTEAQPAIGASNTSETPTLSASSTSSPTSSVAGNLSEPTYSPSDISSTLNIPTRPDGSAPIPINNDHLSAPIATDAVPAGAATYTPSTPGEFDNLDFAAWMKKQKDSDLASKWMIVAPGTYRYKPGTVMPSGTDANTVAGENIAIGFTPGGWTLDLRHVTFYIDITPENQNQRPGDMIYINQSEDFTILGGTIWIDQGEEWTQARVTSISAADDQGNQVATMEVEQGYNVSAWRAAGPRNQGCVDDSDPNHFTRPDCNFWYASKYDFSNVDTKRTFTASIGSRSGIQEGYVLTMLVIINSLTTISTENNGGFKVKGFTSNGYLGSIGLNGKVAPIFEDVYYVNPPPRPGFAPRVQGPAVGWGNIGGPIYNGPGQALAELPGSVWQTTGCEKDLQSAGNGTAPS